MSDEKKAFGAVSLINKGSRKATFSVTWDKTLPLVFSPSEVQTAIVSFYRSLRSHPMVILYTLQFKWFMQVSQHGIHVLGTVPAMKVDEAGHTR